MVETVEKQITIIRSKEGSLVEKVKKIGDVLIEIHVSQLRIEANQGIETELVKNVFEVLNEMVKILKQGTFVISKKKMEKIKKKFKIFHFSKLEED